MAGAVRLLIPYYEESEDYESHLWLYNGSGEGVVATVDTAGGPRALRVGAWESATVRLTEGRGIGWVETKEVKDLMGEVLLRPKDGRRPWHRFALLEEWEEYRERGWRHVIRLFDFGEEASCELLYCRWPMGASPFRPAKFRKSDGQVPVVLPSLVDAETGSEASFPGRLTLGSSGRLVYSHPHQRAMVLEVNTEGPMWFGVMTRHGDTADSFASEVW